jgi:glycosyltransferase involved in cell wall biosynthesis
MYEYGKFRAQEIDICRRKDAILTTSFRDAKVLQSDVPDVPMYVVPNGVDTTYFSLREEPREPQSLVFTGSMNYVPNADGAEYFLDEIFPLIQRTVPGVKVYFVGNAPPEHLRERASESVIVTGFVEDVRPYVERASIYVVPLRMGGGTRLKVLEALSMQRPIVTTSIGCEGIDVKNEDTVLIADEPRAFAEAVIQLLQDAPMRRKLVDHGFELVRARYDWTVVGGTLEDAYGAIISRKA